MNHYLVESGEYSDRQVHCVAPTEAAAREIAENAQRWRPPDWSDDYVVRGVTVLFGWPGDPIVIRTGWGLYDGGQEWEQYAETVAGREEPCGPWEMRDPAAAVEVTIGRTGTGARPEASLTVRGLDHIRVRRTYSDVRAQINAMRWTVLTVEEIEAAVREKNPS